MSQSENTKSRKKLLSMVPDRRTFLKGLGVSGVAGLAACEQLKTRVLVPYLVAPEDVTPGVSTLYASTCTGCPAACGLMVTVRDGRPIKLEGRSDHPLSKGGLCALGQAEIRGLYDAGRLRGPTQGDAPTSWADLDTRVRKSIAGGGTVEVLAESITSPTARKTIETFLASSANNASNDGNLTEISIAPGNATAILAAYEAIDGRRTLPSLRFEKADLVVSLASDFLGTGYDPVAHTASYSARRAMGTSPRGALKHLQLAGSLCLSGAAADERWQARASERRGAARWLLGEIATRANEQQIASALGSAPVIDEALSSRLPGLAESLWKARGRSLVVSGSSDLGEQITVALLNRVLKNEGASVDLKLQSEVCRGSSSALDGLRARLEAGSVSVLIALGTDPVDQLIDGESWQRWLGAVPLSVAITDRPTATAAASKVVAAAHHGLECWHDFRPRADVWSLAQPTIRPLYDTRHPLENFLHWGDAKETDYRAHLETTWRSDLFPAVASTVSFGEFWFRSVANAAPFQPIPVVAIPPSASAEEPNYAQILAVDKEVEVDVNLDLDQVDLNQVDLNLEVELIAQVGVRDGSRSFNPWLRELPDPLTRVSWTPTVGVAPSRAKILGVSDGDVIQLTVADQTVTMPVRISPGQHSSVLAVPVGYGRRDGDRHEDRRNGYRLRPGPVAVKKTGKHVALPLAQIHSSPEGRAHVTQVHGYDQHVPAAHHGPVHSLWNERPTDSPHWHMTINLDACTGCSACVIACQAENNTPVVGPAEVERYRSLHWIRLDRYLVGDADNPDVLFQPMLCAQCDNAPCETVCPVAATVHSHDGLNHQAYNRCVGTRYCANNCPYKVRRFNWFDYDRGAPVERMVLNPDVVVRERGVMEKCTFCVQRIQTARIEARASGQPSFEVKTACQQSCPADAIQFGDEVDPNSAVSVNRQSPRAFQALAEIGIKPSITYLARVRSRES